jgi:hypothetical protein
MWPSMVVVRVGQNNRPLVASESPRNRPFFSPLLPPDPKKESKSQLTVGKRKTLKFILKTVLRKSDGVMCRKVIHEHKFDSEGNGKCYQ